MEIECIRIGYTPTSTEGILLIDGVFECFTLEDHAIDWSREKKVAGKTAIPPGRYPVTIDMSTRFGKRMLHILNVPQFDGIRAHAGNKSVNTEGCPLLGDDRTTWSDDWIGESKKAVDRVFEKVEKALERGERVWWRVIEPQKVARAA